MRLNLRQVFFLILILGLFLMTLRPIADPDFWWHLRTGQLIVQTHTIPHFDPFSFTNNGKPWVAHEWLSEVFMYSLYRIGGYGLLIFVFSIVICGAFILAYLRSPQESKPYIAGFTLFLGALATAPTWGVRPQMISLLLTSLFLFVLDRFRNTGKFIYIFPLPIITLVWVNLHAGYFLGLAIISIYIAGDLFDLIKNELQKTEGSAISNLKSPLILSAVLGVSVLTAIANPNGFNILLYPFQTLNSPAMQQFIQEWFSPDFHLLEWQPLALFFLALIGLGMLSRKSISPTKILLTLCFGYAALRSMRNVPLFAVVAIPILAEQVGSLVKIRPEIKTPSRLLKWMIPIMLFCIVSVIGFRFVQVTQGQSLSEAENFPKAAVDWIEKNQPKGNLFNSYGWGGYLIWRLYPQYPVYIDGRADVYGDKFIFTYLDVYRAQTEWEQVLDAQFVQLVLVESESGLASALRQSGDWVISYEDQISIIFERK